MARCNESPGRARPADDDPLYGRRREDGSPGILSTPETRRSMEEAIVSVK